MKPKKVTIVEVARRADVSTATAGRVLGGYGYSGGKTKERVLEAAHDLGYQPNQLARGLITGRTRTIGVIAGDIASPFYANVLRGISDVVEAHGMGLLITNSDETLSREVAATKLLQEKQVDGLIVAPCDVKVSPHLRDVAGAELPIVLIDRMVRDLSADSVAVENVDSTRAQIAKFLDAGHRKVGIVAEFNGSSDLLIKGFDACSEIVEGTRQVPMSTSRLRLRGYLEAHRDAGIPIDPTLIMGVHEHSAASASASVLKRLSEENRPTALFCADGLMSSGAMTAIASLGLRVPQDLSMIGFDDLDWMEFVGSGIGAIAQPRKRIGRAAARLLLARIAGAEGPPRSLLMAPRFIPRNSVLPPP